MVGNNEKDLEEKIHKLEHYIYPKILSEFQESKISIDNNVIKINNILFKNGKEYSN